jgi:hypothetical protein
MHCPLCERLQLTFWFGQVRDIYGKVEEERMFCRYCREGDEKYHDEFTIMSWCDDRHVRTDLLGYILGSPRLIKGYKAAREFKVPRKGSS